MEKVLINLTGDGDNEETVAGFPDVDERNSRMYLSY